jgi:mannonate dehydratase
VRVRRVARARSSVGDVAAPAALGPPTDERGTPPLKITDIKTILTASANIRLVVVKVMTSEPGLYGLGCATFTPDRS